MALLNDYSHYAFVYLMNKREKVPIIIEKFINLINNQKNKTIKVIRSDSAKENINKNLVELFESKGIKHERSCPSTPEQNGKAERLNRTLQEIARCLLFEANLDQIFWGEAINTANYLLNLRPSKSINNKIPYEIWTGQEVNYDHLKIFGCICFVHIPRVFRNKLEPKSKKYLFMGYSENYKGYKVYDPEREKIFVSQDVVFYENQKSTIKNNQTHIVINNINKNCSMNAIESGERDSWIIAMTEELNSLKERETWVLVDQPKDKKIIDCKWVFTRKLDGNGNINRYKARLVAKGFTQTKNIDYHETFSQVSKFTSIRLILKLSLIEKMMIRQLDIKTAFLNGKIDQELYIKQPQVLMMVLKGYVN